MEEVVAIKAELLHILLSRLGAQVELPQLQEASAKAAQGLPNAQVLNQLRFVLNQAQLKGIQSAQLMWRRLDLRRMPVFAWHRGAWYVVDRVATDQLQTVELTDALGHKTTVPESDLQDALVIWLRPPAKRAATQGHALKGNLAARMVWRELFREPGWLTKVVVATVIINVIAVASSLFAMQVYDRVVPTLAYATLTTLVAGMALFIALDWLLKTLRSKILDSLSVSVDKRMSQQVFDHLLHLRLDVQPKSLGTLAAQVSGLDTVRQFFSAGVIFGLIDLPFALMFIGFIAVIGGKVGWVYFAMLPISLGLGFFTQLRLRELLRLQMVRSNERQGMLVDAIRGAESIRANNAAWRFSQEWQAITASIDGYAIQQKAINSFASVTTGSLSMVAYVAAVVVGVWQIEAGLLTMGGMIACSILGGRVTAPMAQAGQYFTQWQGVSQALTMVDQILKLELERRPDQQLLTPEDAPQTLELEKVRFAYPESPVQQVTVDSLKIQSGERVLLVGTVGCGKSTLLKVLAGLYRPDEGRVRLGDADLWEIDPQVVASQVGYLPQTVHLFKGTLRSNLALSGAAADSRLLKVTRDLGVDAIAADRPLGMDLTINEGGEGLSGGQRQLVALARVVIEQPRVWLLDEPTAALDGESETKVWDVLAANVRPEDILIVSTHRPMQAMQLATRVIVMHQGRIVKDGKPEHVMPKVFAQATMAQKVTSIPSKPLIARGASHVV